MSDEIAVDHNDLVQMGWEPDELIEAAALIRADQKAARKAEKRRARDEAARLKREQVAREALTAVAAQHDGIASVEAAKALLGLGVQTGFVINDSSEVTVSGCSVAA